MDGGRSRIYRGGLIAAVAAITLVACTTDEDTSEKTDPSTTTSTGADVDFQRRAFERMCRDAGCSGVAILAPIATPAELRSELANFTDKIAYVSTSDPADHEDADGRFRGGAVLIAVEGIHETERADVRGVDVSIARGLRDRFQRTYFFRWDGSGWIDSSAQ